MTSTMSAENGFVEPMPVTQIARFSVSGPGNMLSCRYLLLTRTYST